MVDLTTPGKSQSKDPFQPAANPGFARGLLPGIFIEIHLLLGKIALGKSNVPLLARQVGRLLFQLNLPGGDYAFAFIRGHIAGFRLLVGQYPLARRFQFDELVVQRSQFRLIELDLVRLRVGLTERVWRPQAQQQES
jgi:hypothetical protein